jgi:hypothetical protein
MASGDKITNQRISSMWHICAELDMEDTTNTFLRTIQKQPDGIYSEANLNEMALFLKWHLGRDNVMSLWFPREVYDTIVGKIVDFPYNRAVVGDLFLPPENAAGGVGECTCDSDAYGSRTAVCFKWNATTLVWTEQDAGSEAAGTWTFTEAAGTYAIGWDDYLTNESFPTKFLTVT